MTAFLRTGGIVSDRMERRRVLIAADLARAVVLVVTGVLSLAGVLEIWQLVALAVLCGAGEAFFGPAFGALAPEIVAPHHAGIWKLQVRSLPLPGLERSARRELGEAVHFVRSQPWLWATLVAASLSLLLFLGPLEALLPFVIRNDLDAGAWGYGAVLSAAGAGAVFASLIVSQRGPPRRYLTFAYGAWIIATLPFIGYACTRWTGLARSG